MNIRMYLFVETNEPDNNNFVEVAVVYFNVKDHSVSVVADKGIVKAIKEKSKAKVISYYQCMSIVLIKIWLTLPLDLRFSSFLYTLHMYVQFIFVKRFGFFFILGNQSQGNFLYIP